MRQRHRGCGRRAQCAERRWSYANTDGDGYSCDGDGDAHRLAAISHSEPHAKSHADPTRHCGRDWDGHCNTYPNRHSDRDRDGHCNTYPNRHSDRDCDGADLNSDPHGDAEA